MVKFKYLVLIVDVTLHVDIHFVPTGIRYEFYLKEKYFMKTFHTFINIYYSMTLYNNNYITFEILEYFFFRN